MTKPAAVTSVCLSVCLFARLFLSPAVVRLGTQQHPLILSSPWIPLTGWYLEFHPGKMLYQPLPDIFSSGFSPALLIPFIASPCSMLASIKAFGSV